MFKITLFRYISRQGFGMTMKGPWSNNNSYKYQYNGKEFSQDMGLELYDYGARWYDPVIGRFTGIDPIADKFPHVTTYNYAENSPILNLDLWGLQKISINDIRNSQGQISSRNVTVSANLKVLNLSSSENYNFNASLTRASEKARSAFSTSMNARVLDSPSRGLTTEDVPINVQFNLSVELVSSIDQVSNTDFMSIIVDKIETDLSEDAAGVANIDGNLSLVEASSMSNPSPEVLLHEFGHNLGLNHTSDGSGLMGSKVNGQTSVSKEDLKNILLGLGVGGQSTQKRYENTASNAINFLKDNTGTYDQQKAKKAGIN